MADSRSAANDVAPGGSPAETVSYDGDGRLLNDGAKSYLWEMQGWLCGVTSAGNHYQYIYDAEGRLVTTASLPDANCALGTTTLADYIVDQFGRQITEADGSARWRHTNVYADGELLSTYDGAGLHYALNDWLGDKRVQALASSTGTTVEETCWNLPFNDGFGCSGTGTDATEQHYTGKEHDKYVPQLDHFGARSYTNYSGRFLSPDWSSNPISIPFVRLGNPQTLNLYNYAGNNPLSNIDIDGHADCDDNGGLDCWLQERAPAVAQADADEDFSWSGTVRWPIKVSSPSVVHAQAESDPYLENNEIGTRTEIEEALEPIKGDEPTGFDWMNPQPHPARPGQEKRRRQSQKAHRRHLRPLPSRTPRTAIMFMRLPWVAQV